MSKIYAIKLDNGNLHKNNLGEIVYFSNKSDVRAYMKYNHYDGTIQPINIDLEKDRKISDLEAKLAEKDKLLNQYPYKNDVIEKQYDELKQCIEYLPTTEEKTQSSFIYSICNSVDVLCDKHKARIRDIENQICHIEQLEKQLAEKEKEIKNLVLAHFESETNKPVLTTTQMINQEKISFAVEKLEKVKNFVNYRHFDFVPDGLIERFEVEKKINNQIEELKKEMK